MKTTVTAADIKASSMVQRLIAKGAPAQSRKPRAAKVAPAANVDAKALVFEAVRAASAKAPQGDLLHVRAVRAGCPGLDKAAFDRAALELQAEGRIYLTHHDAWAWLPAAQQAELVDGGEYKFNGIGTM